MTATELYEVYCNWCEDNYKEPMALPMFGRSFGDLGVAKLKSAGRIKYKGIKLSTKVGNHEEDRTPERETRIAAAA